MASPIIEQFEWEYSRGEMDELTRCTLPFLKLHWEELKEFTHRFAPLIGLDHLDIIVKLFILHNNMPFDMGLYMKSQRDFIENTLSSHALNSSPETRREAVAQWIRDNAQKHRHTAILKQVLCFERNKDQIVPLLQKALDHNTPDLLN